MGNTVYSDEATTPQLYGGVLISGGDNILLRQSSKEHDGFLWTFAETVRETGETGAEAAISAVLELTGYQARIRMSLPGLFGAGLDTAQYFLMDARHPPAKAPTETTNLRWVSQDDAMSLLKQNLHSGKQDQNLSVIRDMAILRDLSILKSAWIESRSLTFKDRLSTRQEDFTGLEVIPENHIVLHPQLHYSREEMEQIERGLCPRYFENKWIIYYSSNRLKMHRRMYGNCEFDVGFALNPDGSASVTDVIANQPCNEMQNHNGWNEERIELVEFVIRNVLLDPDDY